MMHTAIISKALVLVLLAVGAHCMDCDICPGKWVDRHATGTLPGRVESGTMVALGEKVYLFGGMITNLTIPDVNTFSNKLFVFNTDTNVWQLLGPTAGSTAAWPSARAFHAAAMLPSGKMLIFGGGQFAADFSFSSPNNELWSYDVHSNVWTLLSPVNAGPVARYEPTYILVNERHLHIIEGVDAFFTSLPDTWRYDSVRNSWTLLTSGVGASCTGSTLCLNPPRGLSMPFYDFNRIAIGLYGGDGVNFSNTADPLYSTNDVWRYDIRSGNWIELTANASIQPKHHASAHAQLLGMDDDVEGCLYNNYMLINGGDAPGGLPCCGGGTETHATLADTWVYNIRKNTFTQVFPTTVATPSERVMGAAFGANTILRVGGWQIFQDPVSGLISQIWDTKTWTYELNFSDDDGHCPP